MDGFEWRDGTGVIHCSLMSLVNKNNGKWKSDKQANFMLDRHARIREVDTLKTCFGIIVDENAYVIETSAFIQNAAYGSRGVIPYTHFFIVDEVGIVAVYRIRYRGNMRDGCSPNTKKTECKWVREAQK